MSNKSVFMHDPIIRKGAAQEIDLLEKLFTVLFKVINEVPSTGEMQSSDALLRARKLTAEASFKAAAISGALAFIDRTLRMVDHSAGPLGHMACASEARCRYRRRFR